MHDNARDSYQGCFNFNVEIIDTVIAVVENYPRHERFLIIAPSADGHSVFSGEQLGIDRELIESRK